MGSLREGLFKKRWPVWLKSEDGFSLFELLIAMFILFLIVMAFTPFLLASIGYIHYAGDKSEALYEGQSEMEVSIAEKSAEEESKELEFIFDDTTITVRGGIVDVLETKPESKASAWLSGFIPYIPSISADPSFLIEGYSEVPIEVELHDPPSQDALENLASDYIVIYEHSGPKIDEVPYTICNNNDKQCLEFYFPEGLPNSRSPYMITLTLHVYDEELEEEIEIFLETRLQIALPYAVAVGGGQSIFMSPNIGDIWKSKPHSTLTSGTGMFNDIIWTEQEYVAVSNTGRVIHWINRQDPQRAFEFTADKRLNSIASDADGKLVAVGNDGYMIYSNNVEKWHAEDGTTIDKAGNNNLMSVSWNDYSGKFVLVGDSGTILYSNDNGVTWDTEIVDWAEEDQGGDDVDFRGIAHGPNCSIAVGKGNEGAVIYKSIGDNWEKVQNSIPDEVSENELNDIIYDNSVYIIDGKTYENDRFLAVGEDGTILLIAYDNEVNDLDIDVIESDTNFTLNAIDWAQFGGNQGYYLAAGESGVITTWTGLDTDNWEKIDPSVTGINQNINGVAIRWTP